MKILKMIVRTRNMACINALKSVFEENNNFKMKAFAKFSLDVVIFLFYTMSWHPRKLHFRKLINVYVVTARKLWYIFN